MRRDSPSCLYCSALVYTLYQRVDGFFMFGLVSDKHSAGSRKHTIHSPPLTRHHTAISGSESTIGFTLLPMFGSGVSVKGNADGNVIGNQNDKCRAEPLSPLVMQNSFRRYGFYGAQLNGHCCANDRMYSLCDTASEYLLFFLSFRCPKSTTYLVTNHLSCHCQRNVLTVTDDAPNTEDGHSLTQAEFRHCLCCIKRLIV
jgi:hypothetical protein